MTEPAPARWSSMNPAPLFLRSLHARPFVPLETPRRVYHFAFATNDDEARADRGEIERLASSHDCAATASDAKFESLTFGAWDLRWEQHTEFTTYTWSTSRDAATPFSHPDPLGAGEVKFRAPGRLIVAAHLCVVGREQLARQACGTVQFAKPLRDRRRQGRCRFDDGFCAGRSRGSRG